MFSFYFDCLKDWILKSKTNHLFPPTEKYTVIYGLSDKQMECLLSYWSKNIAAIHGILTHFFCGYT